MLIIYFAFRNSVNIRLLTSVGEASSLMLNDVCNIDGTTGVFVDQWLKTNVVEI